jgi:hypothetical protein
MQSDERCSPRVDARVPVDLEVLGRASLSPVDMCAERDRVGFDDVEKIG